MKLDERVKIIWKKVEKSLKKIWSIQKKGVSLYCQRMRDWNQRDKIN
jgi:hypothetical protein